MLPVSQSTNCCVEFWVPDAEAMTYFWKRFSLSTPIYSKDPLLPRVPAIFYGCWTILVQATWLVGLTKVGTLNPVALVFANFFGMILTRLVGRTLLHWSHRGETRNFSMVGTAIMCVLTTITLTLLIYWATLLPATLWVPWVYSFFPGLAVETLEIAALRKMSRLLCPSRTT